MDERRAYLKELAARSARRWSSTPLPDAFAGETRIETRNTCYQLRDGVCYAVTRHQWAGAGRSHPSEFVGMRVVGWLLRDTPTDGITHEYQPGAYAVLWRPREGREEHSAVALTSTTHEFKPAARASTPPPLPRITSRPGRITIPPPLPPPPPPPAPETPTPSMRRSSVPPPLPPMALGRPPLALRPAFQG